MAKAVVLNEMSMNPSCPFPGTIRNSVIFGEHVCPVECAAKLLLFLGVSTIILYVPLGRFTYCDTGSPLTIWNEHTSPMCCLCDIYKTIVHIGNIIKESVDRTVFSIVNTLYEGKLQFYQLLGSLDNRDLCRSVCCDDVEPRCRCPKHKPCKHRT